MCKNLHYSMCVGGVSELLIFRLKPILMSRYYRLYALDFYRKIQRILKYKSPYKDSCFFACDMYACFILTTDKVIMRKEDLILRY